MTEDQKYNYYIEDTIFEDAYFKEAKQAALNEGHVDTTNTYVDPLIKVNFAWIGVLFAGVFALLMKAFKTLGALVALKKLKNLMSRVVYWIQYGSEKGIKKFGKSNNYGEGATLNYFNSETEKDKECFITQVMGSERQLLLNIEKLRHAMGIDA